MKLSHLISTFLFVGHMRPAPGTWGSLAALPVGWALMVLGGPVLFAAALGLVIASGTWAITLETKDKENKDPSEIVIDEVAGQWIALLPVVIGASVVGAPYLALWPGWVSAFVLFRLFDIWKPGWIGRADRRGDAWGVMLDDLLAGLFAALCAVVMAGIAHGIMRL